MGSAAFLNEAINQLAEAYISRKEKETGEIIGYEKRFNELQKVKMYIADRNVYGIDLNPVAVELAEVSLWLNTIYEGGFVPWFGTQLVNGNSLIGARRQVYRIENAQATSKGLRWYEMEPERLAFGTDRADKGYRFGRKQIYHFLLGDPGMCSYSDKVIKSLEPDKIKEMAKWKKKFTEPISDDDVITLLRLSETIDELWEAQIKLRREVGAKTQDALSIFGHEDDAVDSHTTIRQKDKIFSELYKSEHMRNAGPYARLKFAMDYWCALWFWPINKAELLPTRSEFLFDMSLILEGTMASVNVTDSAKDGQLSLFPTEMEQMAMDIIDTYGTDTIVDIPRLRQENSRLDLVARIAEKNKFMHWELEFADLFAERGGFDLIIGNPPWVKMEWDETGVLSDKNPSFAIKNIKAAEVAKHRQQILEITTTWKDYFSEYESMAGQQTFLGAKGNYPDISGAVNLYKCFLPQAWLYGTTDGISAFVHPDGVFDDPKGAILRGKIYTKLRKHLNIYGNKETFTFDTIANLFYPTTIDQCYDKSIRGRIPGIKDENGNWNTCGHPKRVVHVGKKELELFASLIPAIIPKCTGHIDGLFGIANKQQIPFWAACLSSLPYDYLIKVSGKSNCRNDLMSKIPFPKRDGAIAIELSCRALLLNCLDKRYSELWADEFKSEYLGFAWAKEEARLDKMKYQTLEPEWSNKISLRTDYERRQALIEIDVLTAFLLGMTLEQLKTIYRIQFPVLQAYEADTWYDISGRIVFTNNRSLTGVGVERKVWENIVRDMIDGESYIHSIIDDTMPGGPMERTIRYTAPFVCCDREKDYETAWKFFEKKYGK